jgi:uncharacterized protein YecT (DUF1311 family)
MPIETSKLLRRGDAANMELHPAKETSVRARSSLLLVATMLLACAAAPAARAADCGSGSQAEMNDCYGKAYKTSDAELNSLYRKITAQLKDDKDTTKLLVTAQKAWLAYRDAECNFTTAGSAGGTIYPMVQAICLDQLTTTRAAEFRAYLDCAAGDTSCISSIH